MRVISESKTLFGMMMDNHGLYSSVKIDDLSIDNYNLLEKKLKRLERKVSINEIIYCKKN